MYMCFFSSPKQAFYWKDFHLLPKMRTEEEILHQSVLCRLVRANDSKAHIKETTASNINLSKAMESRVSRMLVSSCWGAERQFTQPLLVPCAEHRAVPAASAVESTDLALTGLLSFLGMAFVGNEEEWRGKKKAGSGNDSSTWTCRHLGGSWTMSLITPCNVWSALKRSGSWTRWSL